MNKKLEKYRIVLGSQSPRRQYLLKELGINFDVKLKYLKEEVYPENLQREEIPLYLAKAKADAFEDELGDKTIVITADTIVWSDGKVLQKPQDTQDAYNILKSLSGKVHQVYTAVCLKSAKKITSFYAQTDVYFRELTDKEIWFYINEFEPFDKAGAYGIQEWLGYIGIEKIEGSYFNVMGLPLQKLYVELNKFIATSVKHNH
ncbi:MAG: Maf family nucleotide pyrophosphatase [Bacteroidales bacterium]